MLEEMLSSYTEKLIHYGLHKTCEYIGEKINESSTKKSIKHTDSSDCSNIKTKNNLYYTISNDCVMCGTCADECPSEAISEGESKYVINPDMCVDCGTCADACPSGAIVQASKDV